MKRIILYFTMCVATTMLLMRFTSNTTQGEATEKDTDAGAMASGDYWNKMRANQVTGKVDPADEIRAMLAVEKFDKTNTSTRSIPAINWNFRGPDNVGGRTRAVLIDRKTGNIFAGGVSGGLWISKDKGGSFQPWAGNTSDTVQAITVCALCQAANGDIYFGTGEGQYLNNGTGTGGFPGGGIWKSSDGGATFNLIPSTKPTLNNSGSTFTHVNRMVASPKRAGVVYAGTNRGLYKSIDSGATWTVCRRGIGTSQEVTDVEISADDQYVYACTQTSSEYGTGYFYKGLSNNSKTDTLVQSSYFSAQSRMECAISHDSGNYVYVTQASASDGSLTKVWQSKDHGSNWTVIGTGTGYDPNNALSFDPFGNQGNYDIVMEVVPGYKDVLFLGGQLQLWRWSASNGWELASGNGASYYIHPDMHVITFNPNNPSNMILGCDGGLFKSNNANVSPSSGLPTFQAINHSYSVTQQYSVASNATNSVTMGGAQDNGTHLVDGSGYTKYSGKEVSGGDGGKCEISQYNSAVAFAALVSSEGSTQSGGFVYRSINGGATFSSVWDRRTDVKGGSDGKKNGGIDEGAAFVAPYLLWEGNYPSPWVYTDTSYLAIGTDNGTVWVSPWATNTSAPLTWFELQGNGQGVASCIATSSDGNQLYVGYGNGALIRYSGLKDLFKTGRWHYYTDTAHANTWNATDSGITMTNLGNFGQYVTGISVDFNNPNHMIVSLGGYGNSNFIYQSKNAKSIAPSFTAIQGSGSSAIPAMPIYSVCVDAADTSVLLAGTEMGVYVSGDAGSTWVHKSAGMGNLPITAIRQYFQNGVWNTFVATHGHGIYSTGLWTGTNDIYGAPQNIANGKVYPNPSQNFATLRFHTVRNATYTLNMFDLSGNLVYTQNPQTYFAGDNYATLPVSHLASGLYIVQLRSDSETRSFKASVIH